ncbi:MAG: hypothetical protein ACRD2J_11290 [Thermoanaerobaculia bacterium]
MTDRKEKKKDRHEDPLSREPGAHPLGVGGGAAGGAAAGAAIGGAVGGPAGAAVGGAIGAVAGGYAGKGIAEAVNPTEEEAHWRSEYPHRPYARPEVPYDRYQPAYRFGWEKAVLPTFTGRSFEDIEPELEHHWHTTRGEGGLAWNEARPAVRDAWDRVRTRGR